MYNLNNIIKRYRLGIFNSSKHFYIQIFEDIDKYNSKTILSLSTLDLKITNNTTNIIKLFNQLLLLLNKKKISHLYFKRQFKQRYQGKIKIFINMLRKNNINI